MVSKKDRRVEMLLYLCKEKILAMNKSSLLLSNKIVCHTRVREGSHLFALCCDVPRSFYDPLSSIVMLIDLLPEMLEHEHAWRFRIRCIAGISRLS